MESLFELLFKLRPAAFDSGSFAFEAARPVLGLAVALGLATTAAYRRRRERAGKRRVALLTGLRVVALMLLAFALLRPVLKVSAVVPGENFLAVLVDDSKSMRLPDGELTRGERALEVLGAGPEGLLARLRERFTVRTYRFGAAAARVDPATLAFGDRATDLGEALGRVRRDLAGVPLAGAVLLTDGADNAEAGDGGDAVLNEELLQLASRGIPIYAVALGEERFERDLELGRVDAPSRVLEGSAFAADVSVRQQGYGGETVELVVERDGAIVERREVDFERGQAESTARVHLKAEGAGSHRYRFALRSGDGEQVAENDAREVLVSVEDRLEKILYFEGEPRFEVRFLRQAVAGDDHLRLVVLLRTAENKLLRLGVDDPLELVSGFPETREELFAYRGLVLGSVAAASLSANQLRIVEEFVGQRGGGLLLLGGRASFAEGGWAGTPLADLSPLVMPPAGAGFFAEVKVGATPDGLDHAALQLAADRQSLAERWRTLPPLSMRHRLDRAKPGASVLLRGRGLGGGEADAELIVLASQRYGRGRVAAFPVQDSWIWQMHAQVPLEDETHERLWRQLLRWLVSEAPRRLELSASTRQPAPGEPVSLRAEVRDGSFLGVNGAEVSATVTGPDGGEQTLPLEWTVEEDGEYRATFVPELPGSYDVRVMARVDGENLGGDAIRVVAAEPATEFFGAEMNAALLRRIAAATGGRLYDARDASDLAEDARYTESGKTVIETVELWDMPIVLLLLLSSLCAEWLLRRRWGLV